MRELFNPERQIQHLTVEAPKDEKHFVFDIRKEVTEAQIDAIIEKIRQDQEQQTLWAPAYAEIAAAIAILFPEKTDQLSSEKIWRDLYEAAESPGHANLLTLLSNMAVLKQEAVIKWLEEHPGYSFDDEKLRSDMMLALGRINEVLSRAYSLALIFPQRIAELDLDDEDIRLFNATQAAHDPFNAAQAKVLFPDKSGRLAFTQSDFETGVSQFHRYRDRLGGYEYLIHGVSLKILAASHAAITENGLEIVDASGIVKGETTSPLPEQRKY